MAERPFSLQAVQKTELNILKDVRAFCSKNDIRYYLYCGTLLGCIRHKGFIPWDDDIDLAMPLPDYKKFSALVFKDKDFLERYTVSGAYTDFRSPERWMKIIRKNTVYIEKACLGSDIDKGISLDIYPLIGVYDNALLKYVQSKAIRLQHVMHLWDIAQRTDYYYLRDPEVKKKLKRFSFFPHSIRVFLINLIKRIFWPVPGKYKTAGTIDAAPFAGKFESEKWEEAIDGVFEGEKFTIPKEYDTFLKTMYGDYMKLPPKENRVYHRTGEVYFDITPVVAEEVGLII